MFVLHLLIVCIICNVTGGTVLTLTAWRREAYNRSYYEIYLNSTTRLVSMRANGTVFYSCPWCPSPKNMTSEINFLMKQVSYVDNLTLSSNATVTKDDVGVLYTFFFLGTKITYHVEHIIGPCYTTFIKSTNSSTSENCSSLEFDVRGIGMEGLLKDIINVRKRWTHVMETIVYYQRIENVNASFYINNGLTYCLFSSKVPVHTSVKLYGPNLRPVTIGTMGNSDEGMFITVYNASYPNVACEIKSPTGWTGIIRFPIDSEENRVIEPVIHKRKRLELQQCCVYDNDFVNNCSMVLIILGAAATLYLKRNLLSLL
ncbi:a155 [Rat cytomegalovirus ALL-03]|uniref:A155 n=2 Tax=Rat cytomegalovirus (isolate England) TaxID=1261657 RepID=A0A0F6R594_RCMVE|nr:e155 [Murid betaherpesvirus 8]AKE44306.1 a155 [Rat cytomegalovirus ALL-03]AFX83456.1 e155 [Murid betaherpesvirus 8]WEG71929.1 membrane protein e153 [Murid betaherpesvirus 8]WPH25319.1 membrane protein e153 [Murid betaherpesvirus 8]WPH25452.1 membrane protein e153 [Murid betaherpesvirus 8]